MKRQIDIDLLLPKIMKLETQCGGKRTFSASQVLWILEQEFALQNDTDNNTGSSYQSDGRKHDIEISSNMSGCNAKIFDCQNELSEIKAVSNGNSR